MDPPPNPQFLVPSGTTPIIITTNPTEPMQSETVPAGQIYITKDPVTHRPVMVRKRVGNRVGLTGYLAASIRGGREHSTKSQPNPPPASAQFVIVSPPSLPQFELVNQAGLLTYRPAQSPARVEEVKEEAKENEKASGEEKEKEKASGEVKEKEKASDEGKEKEKSEDKKDKEDPPKPDDASAPKAEETPPIGQDTTGKLIQQHVCAGCGKIRSASYHYRLHQNAGADPPPNFCRKCINEITSSEEDDDDNAVDGRRFLERRRRNQLTLRQENLKQDAGSTASSDESLRHERRKQRHDSSHRRRGPGRRIQVLISDGEDDDKATGVMIMRDQGQRLVGWNHQYPDMEGFHPQTSRKSPTRSRSSSDEHRAPSKRTLGRGHVREYERKRMPSDDYHGADAEHGLVSHPLPYRHEYHQEVDRPIVEGRSGRLPFIRRRSYSMHENGMSYEQSNLEYHHRCQDTRRHAEEFNEERYTGDRRHPPPLGRPRLTGRSGEALRADPRDEDDRYWDSDVAEVGDNPERVRFRQERDILHSRHEEPRWDPPEVYSTETTRDRGVRRRYATRNYIQNNPRDPVTSEEEGYYSPSDDTSSTRTQRRYNRPARAPSPPRAVPLPRTKARYLARHAYVDDEDDEEEISRAMREARLQGRGRRREVRRERERERSTSPSLLTSAWGSGRRGSRGGRW